MKFKRTNQFKYLALIPVLVVLLFNSSCSESTANVNPVIEKQIQTKYRYYKGELKGFKGRNSTYLDDLLVGKWPEKMNEIQFEDLTKNEQEELISYQQNGFLELGTAIKLFKMPNGRNTIGILMPAMEFDKTDVKIDEIIFLKITNAPVFPDCEEQDYDCFFSKMKAHFNSTFDRNIVDDIFVSPGIQKVIVDFSIDTNGEVIDVTVKGNHIVIEQEVKRVIKSLPKMKAGNKDEVMKKTKYTLPFKIIID
ncbi:hypothetical protein [Polaribacter sp. R77954]|uniref:hypothetical protein n=1 Tax=Polaribacter sp. R77954 TaxID=3093870 RepID=UPI0037CBAAF2